MKKAAGILVFVGAMTTLPIDAAAQMYANPFLAKLSKIEFNEPTVDGPSGWGISAGGGEIAGRPPINAV